MNHNDDKVIVIGAGGGGLSAAVGLAQAGYDVTVLECRPGPFQKQSGVRGGQGRLHFAGYYPGKPLVAQAIMRESALFMRQMPDAVVPVDTRYFVAEAKRDQILAGWKLSGVTFREEPGDRSPICPGFRRKFGVGAFKLEDKVIDPVRLAENLKDQLQHHGGRLVCQAELIGSQRVGNRIVAVIARTTAGLRRSPCDVLINAAGAGMQRVLTRVSPQANLAGYFKTVATAVLRFPWPFSIDPSILQFFGPYEDQLLKNLSLIPVGRSRLASVATSGGLRVDPNGIRYDIQSQHRELSRLVAEGFGFLQLPEPQEITWCVKALLVHPDLKESEGETGARLVTVLPAVIFGGSDNELLVSPGKLGSVLSLRKAVLDAVRKLEETREAA